MGTRGGAVGRGEGGDVVQGIAVAGLVMGQRQLQFAAGDGRNQRLLLRRAAGVAQQAAAEDDGGEVGFERQAAAEHLHHQHDVDAIAAQAAVILAAGQGMNIARQVGVKLGLPNEVPAYTINKACGSTRVFP